MVAQSEIPNDHSVGYTLTRPGASGRSGLYGNWRYAHDDALPAPRSANSCNLVEHTAENPAMYGTKRVPIEESRQSGRIKNSGLPKDGVSAVWFNLELKPRTTQDFHFCDQSQATIRLTGYHSPESGEHHTSV